MGVCTLVRSGICDPGSCIGGSYALGGLLWVWMWLGDVRALIRMLANGAAASPAVAALNRCCEAAAQVSRVRCCT